MRLTKKNENGFYELTEGNEIWGAEDGTRLVQIVGNYEDSKEELGINLLTFIDILKATKVYHKEYGWVRPDLYFFDTENPKKWCFDTFDKDDTIRLLWIKDFGTLWALTEEQLNEIR